MTSYKGAKYLKLMFIPSVVINVLTATRYVTIASADRAAIVSSSVVVVILVVSVVVFITLIIFYLVSFDLFYL